MLSRLLGKKGIIGGFLAAALVGSLILFVPQTPGASSCKDTCYSAKSNNYKRCRAIPPQDRGARVKCFKNADSKLQRCLSSCKP